MNEILDQLWALHPCATVRADRFVAITNAWTFMVHVVEPKGDETVRMRVTIRVSLDHNKAYPHKLLIILSPSSHKPRLHFG